MWQRFNNFISSLTTYRALSPDLRVRRQVNQRLRRRPALSVEQWFETFYQPQGMTYSVVAFAYQQLPLYSGLDIARVLPDDHLYEDLCWAQVCWFDWQLNLCEDFCHHFGIEESDSLALSDCLEKTTLFTIRDLIALLNTYGVRSLGC
ncbi:MAG: hypothetical protein IGS50_19830 [Synechococcales cyanobacterium C42_A2020_086]|nr:hypothetical protein [Synechococcales cyanobacterium M58_A2018_015]MBF2075989.1 hypothetical protein [Synechococcales cyanobacterium C42_A2020_086]